MSTPEASEPPVQPAWRHWFRWVAYAILATLLLLAFVSPMGREWRHPEDLRILVADHGASGALVFLGLCSVLQIAGASRLALAGIGGLMYGFPGGLGLSLGSSLISSLAVYGLARQRQVSLPATLAQRLRVYGNADGIEGILTVFLIRQMPLPGTLISLALGSLRVATVPFAAGTLLGLLPLAVPAVAIGSGLASPTHAHRLGYVAVGCAALAAIVLGIRVIRSVHRR